MALRKSSRTWYLECSSESEIVFILKGKKSKSVSCQHFCGRPQDEFDRTTKANNSEIVRFLFKSNTNNFLTPYNVFIFIFGMFLKIILVQESKLYMLEYQLIIFITRLNLGVALNLHLKTVSMNSAHFLVVETVKGWPGL